ncbi:MAG: MFS transporter [Chloroflexota bacterium]
MPEKPRGRRGARLPRSLAALRHRNYRLLFFAQMIAQCGYWMQATAQGWLVLRLTDSPFWLGTIAFAQSLPVLLLALPGGTLADRLPKRTLLLCTQAVAMASALTLAGLTLSGAVQVWHVLAAALVVGSVAALEGPARQSFTIELVGRADLMNAIALDSLVLNGARIVGPAAAGMLAAAIGEGPAFLMNGLSILAVIAGLLMMRLGPFQAPPRRSGLDQLREGLGYIRSEPKVRLMLLQMGVLCVFGLAYIPLLPYFARNVLGGDARGYGLLASTNAVGALSAALMIAVLGERLPRVRLRSVALLSYSLLLGGFTLTRSFPPAMLLIAAVGWAGITSLTLSNTLLQIVVPDELRGRVMSVYTLMIMGVSQLSGVMLSGLAELVGDVPLTVGCWAAVGWFLQLLVHATHSRVRLEPGPAPVTARS